MVAGRISWRTNSKQQQNNNNSNNHLSFVESRIAVPPVGCQYVRHLESNSVADGLFLFLYETSQVETRQQLYHRIQIS